MKIAICNVPLRDKESKTTYPPLGALAVMQALRSAGHDVSFYDINCFRPDDKELKNYFVNNGFDIVGISATVSTSYQFVKKLALMIKGISKDTVIMAGGSITASSEIILKFTRVDYCIIGEGERVVVNLLKYIELNRAKRNYEGLKGVKGLCFLDEDGSVAFTGHEQQIPADEIEDPDFEIIRKFSNLDNYIISPLFYEQFKYDERTFQPRREHKKLATVVTSRGCVNRCTFCHRWQKGIRILEVDRIIEYIKKLRQDYNVDFISFGDEDFGASKKWLEEFIEKIKPLDILYRISGICADNVDYATLQRLKDSGCVAVHYGFESGSDKMLKVMEKRADVDRNIKVANWTLEAGLQTVYALVVGMPGESYETISQTVDFLKRVAEFSPNPPTISVNALVVLPGTPVYEYARQKGCLGDTLSREEEYLLRISNKGGESFCQLNLTDYPYFIVQGWIRCICWAAHYHYHKRNKLPKIPRWELFVNIIRILFKQKKRNKDLSRYIFANPLFYHLRYIIAPIWTMRIGLQENTRIFMERCSELLLWPFKKRVFKEYVSLRSLLNEQAQNSVSSTQLLRLSR